MLPEDQEELASDESCMRAHNKKFCFILKPENSCQGNGILLCRGIEDIKNLDPGDDKYICQEYLMNPLLIEGLKFDLRL